MITKSLKDYTVTFALFYGIVITGVDSLAKRVLSG